MNLYPEGSFYKAYQQSAWLLCTRVHPFKVSARPLKGFGGPLLSVGFPMTSLDKFSAGLSGLWSSLVAPGKSLCITDGDQGVAKIFPPCLLDAEPVREDMRDRRL